MIAPAVLAEPVAADIPAQRAVVAAVLKLEIAAPEAAAGQFHLAARLAEAALGTDGERAAQRIQAEQRVRAGHQFHAGNRRMRQQFPVDRVAEGLVDAHAVDIDRQALRRAEQRRGGEAAVIEIDLEGIALDLVHVDAGQLARHEFGQVEAFLLFELAAADRLHIGRHLPARNAEAGQRRVADHLDGGGFDQVFGGQDRAEGGGQREAEGGFGDLSHVVFLSL